MFKEENHSEEILQAVDTEESTEQAEQTANIDDECTEECAHCEGENSECEQCSASNDEIFEDPIITCTYRFIHSVADVEEALEQFVPLAFDKAEKQSDFILEQYKLADQYAKDESSQTMSASIILKTNRLSDRYVKSQVPRTLVKSLFLNVFSDFDTFTGELLASIYEKKPVLYQSISKNVPFSDILKYADIDTLKTRILSEDIENFRRKSYVEQFDELEKQFSIKTLKDFKNWAVFVEATQRRNLFMHCDGIVSEQYIKICSEHKCDLKNVKVGDKLTLSYSYLTQVLDVMSEVAIKLANVLWRKVLPEETELSDDALHHFVFDYLNDEKWARAINIADFVRHTARSKTDLMQKINLTNLVIAHKFSGSQDIAKKILRSQDWSASIHDFRLSAAVLEDDFDEAHALMLQIGVSSDLICERAYLEWPLFKQFRNTEQFLSAFAEVYGYPFITKMQQSAHDHEKEVDEKDISMIQVVSDEDETSSDNELLDASEKLEDDSEDNIDSEAIKPTGTCSDKP
ncbi:hypothetical protein MD535_11850 [Vibrio sp. ZSDZ65]|uniref:Uncharacterized protein n=1 Tax=Vibrio qingdaonensis TaxID=2829491 RepID=A0A9X3CNI7_9VIBR|nr:hypothetical protein [Vibrio qingdaonensis]MCW8346691.1 hypothetical protein [Vibrio qingdaonensis]